MSLRGLAGKVVVVTGGGQGIGRAYAHRFVDEGCSVVVADLNAERAASVCEELKAKGGRALSVQIDVSREEDCRRMAATAVAEWGRIDTLVNNAAIFSTIKMKPFWELTVTEWDALMAVILKGVWLATRAVLPTCGSRAVEASSTSPPAWCGSAARTTCITSPRRAESSR